MIHGGSYRWVWVWAALSWVGCQSETPPVESTSTVHLQAALDPSDSLFSVQFDVFCADGTTFSTTVPLVTVEAVDHLNISAGHLLADLYAVLPVTSCSVTLTALDAFGAPTPDCTSPTVALGVTENQTAETVVYLTCAPLLGTGISGCLLPDTTCYPTGFTCDWVPRPTTTPCEDGLGCTTGDTCDGAGVCGIPNPALCNDGIPCTDPECDPVFGCLGVPTVPTCNTDCSKGDVNGNNLVDVVDAQCSILLTLWQLGGMVGPVPGCLVGDLSVADLDCYGTVNVADILILIGFALKQPLSPAIDRNNNICHDHCDQKYCGDGTCAGPEDCLVCPTDCGSCEGSCCVDHPTPSCESPTVADCVCAAVPTCCSVLSAGWTAQCVQAAAQCGGGCQ